MEWITRLSTEDEVTNIECPIAVFYGTRKDYGNSEPDINSWAQPVSAIEEIIKIDAT